MGALLGRCPNAAVALILDGGTVQLLLLVVELGLLVPTLALLVLDRGETRCGEARAEFISSSGRADP